MRCEPHLYFIEGKAVKGSSERVWEANEFQSRKDMGELAAASGSLSSISLDVDEGQCDEHVNAKGGR